MWWVLFSQAWAGPCDSSFGEGQLEASVTGAEEAVRDLDDSGFRDQLNALAGFGLPCLGVTPAPAIVARYHRLMALHLYSLGDKEGAHGAASASRRLDGSPPPPDLLPADHALRAVWDSEAEGGRHKVPQPVDGSVAFDGAVTRYRPDAVPVVFQQLDASGLVQSTKYLGAREPLPEYAAVPRRRTTLVVATSVVSAAAVASFGVAATAHARLYRDAYDLETPSVELDGYRRTANVWTVVGAVGLLAAGGLGTGAALVGSQ